MRFAPAFVALALLLFGSSAMAQYGVEFTAPDTTKTICYPDSTVFTSIHFPLHIKNTGSVNDRFVVDFPSQNLPSQWFATFCDTFLCFSLPCTLSLNPGDTVPNAIHVAVGVYGETGTGWVTCSVTSVGNPSLHPELRFWLRADPNGVEEGRGITGLEAPGIRIYPNPMRDGCEVLWGEAKGREASLRLYDVQGRLFATLRSTTGFFRWEGRDSKGRAAPAGMYFYVVSYGSRQAFGKLLRIR